MFEGGADDGVRLDHVKMKLMLDTKELRGVYGWDYSQKSDLSEHFVLWPDCGLWLDPSFSFDEVCSDLVLFPESVLGFNVIHVEFG